WSALAARHTTSFSVFRRPPSPTLFPYTTLFRSRSGNLLMTGNVAQSPEEAARRFAQAMWSGDRETMKQLALPRHTSQVSDWLSGQAGRLDPGWAKAELEIAERRTQGLDQVLVVRLWRPLADGDGGEESTPLVALSLRRSARGWLVADWRLEDL